MGSRIYSKNLFTPMLFLKLYTYWGQVEDLSNSRILYNTDRKFPITINFFFFFQLKRNIPVVWNKTDSLDTKKMCIKKCKNYITILLDCQGLLLLQEALKQSVFYFLHIEPLQIALRIKIPSLSIVDSSVSFNLNSTNFSFFGYNPKMASLQRPTG